MSDNEANETWKAENKAAVDEWLDEAVVITRRDWQELLRVIRQLIYEIPKAERCGLLDDVLHLDKAEQPPTEKPQAEAPARPPEQIPSHMNLYATWGADWRDYALALERQQAPAITGETSDGYHTFNELYAHRIKLFIALCKFTGAWRSMRHADGTMFDGWFIMGIGKEPTEQITYHLPIAEWPNTSFCETLPNAPAWDGHTPVDVLTRLGFVQAPGRTYEDGVEAAAEYMEYAPASARSAHIRNIRALKRPAPRAGGENG